MNGSIITKNGILYCSISYKDAKGNRKQKTISTGLKERGNMKKAKALLQNYIVEFSRLELNDGTMREIPGQKSKIRWLDWLDTYIKSRENEISPEAFLIYNNSYNKAFKEFWQNNNPYLADIQSSDLNDFYNYLRTTRNCKEITLKHYSNVLRPACKKAYREKLIPENPHDFIEPFKKEKATFQFYNQDELKILFEKIKGHKTELAIKMLAHYGFRRSELIGLRWEAINFTNKTISINHKVIVVKKKIIASDTLKTSSSSRTLPLLPEIESELLEWKKQINKNMEYFGKSYNMQYKDYIFVHENGDLFLPDYLSHEFHKILSKHNLKYIRLHDLRHSCASVLLANGVAMKDIQEWLGHSDFAITANVYSHLDFSSKIESAERIATALSPKLKTKTQPKTKKQKKEDFLKRIGCSSVEEAMKKLQELNKIN